MNDTQTLQHESPVDQPAATLRDRHVGMIYMLAAYFAWGFIPIYFKAVSHVDPLIVLAHRMVWSLTLLLTLMIAAGRLGELRAALRNRRSALLLVGSAAMIAINWYTFIWAASNRQVLEISLGYFVSPLVSTALGIVVLREWPRRLQIVAIALAMVGVGCMLRGGTGSHIVVPATLALAFSTYGLLRKMAGVTPIAGVTAESLFFFPFAILMLIFTRDDGHGAVSALGVKTYALLVSGGGITAVPLIWYAAGVSRLRLMTVGLLQYIEPTLQFILAVALYHEKIAPTLASAFTFIWIGLAIYTVDAIRASRPAASRVETV